MADEMKLFVFITFIFFHFVCTQVLQDDNVTFEKLRRLEDTLTELENILLDTDVRVETALNKLEDSGESLMRDFNRVRHRWTKHTRKSVRKSKKEIKKQLKNDRNVLKEMINTVENVKINTTVKAGSDLAVNDSFSEKMSDKIKGNPSREIVHSEDISEPRVMFKATMLTNELYLKGDTIIFPKTIHKIGEGYDSEYGIFVTPLEGTYYFTVQLYIYGDRGGAEVGIFVGDECISWAKFVPRHDSCNNLAAITKLNIGDVVYVKQLSNSWATKLYKSTEADLWNTFSAVFIR